MGLSSHSPAAVASAAAAIVVVVTTAIICIAFANGADHTRISNVHTMRGDQESETQTNDAKANYGLLINRN